ncbi:putative C6 transcription factor [Emericellopsis atlantica]|uniref:C6 transcription factor n=1 Tax=Emericellopsis atlantica TaxID=2614577 RepID=A0A9P7ZR00_9HYPO|nr:putative C6 transcription factor [Emericellopsis atlantica]KAG9256236.1 putative C6 transcription factor [Emericellopsis atlantica]
MDNSPSAGDDPPVKRRRRARKACNPCRDRKRKCDGREPCATCVQWEYDCYYGERSTAGSHATQQQQQQRNFDPVRDSEATNDNHVQSLEANSGAAFVRRLGLNIDPKNAPRLRLFAWNTGERLAGYPPGVVRPITSILSQAAMVELSQVYFQKFTVVYDVIYRDVFLDRLQQRWASGAPQDPLDQVLCGVAMLGLCFSQTTAAPFEPDLVETGRTLLEHFSLSSPPSIDTVIGWILRVAYLRITATPHVAWLASCSLMHVCEAAQIHLEVRSQTVFDESSELVSLDIRRRIWAMAQHLNIWPSYDLGRTRIKLPHATTQPVAPIDGDFTSHMLALVPLTEVLDPHQPRSVEDLESDFSQIGDRDYPEPAMTMAVTNLAICTFRRLRAQKATIQPGHVDKMLSLSARGLHAARRMVATHCPWHHAANMPFQILCLCLAVDTRASLAMVRNALSVLGEVRDAWNSAVLREAYDTAYLLILLHQRRKEEDCGQLRAALEMHAPSDGAPPIVQPSSSHQDANANSEAIWLDDLFTNVPGLREFDMDQFLEDDPFNMQDLGFGGAA